MKMIYEGKAKRVFDTLKPNELRLEFKDSLTAFNAQKKGSFKGKGEINCQFASLIFSHLKRAGVDSHWISTPIANEMLVKKLTVIPLEVVVRNILAGSTAKKMGLPEGERLKKPLLEFYFKKDELNDPFVSREQILAFELATESQLNQISVQTFQVNQILLQVFGAAKIDLVDFKIEFGVTDSGQILLADEISPDSCRLWDQITKEKLDKDRFRQDLGQVEEKYLEVFARLKGLPKDLKFSTNSATSTRLGVRILPREVILDTQGRAVEQTLALKGQRGIQVRVGKYVRLEISAEHANPRELTQKLAKDFLHNPLIESFEIIEDNP
jgi:phosphoribosylaminoimidazole-succinocarboxamide synthase